MRLAYTAKAASDIESIGNFIRHDNPSRAASFIEEIFEKCRDLRALPEAFPVYAPDRDMHIRRRVHGRYSIFYRINGDTVVILHVLHSNRNVDRVLFGD